MTPVLYLVGCLYDSSCSFGLSVGIRTSELLLLQNSTRLHLLRSAYYFMRTVHGVGFGGWWTRHMMEFVGVDSTELQYPRGKMNDHFSANKQNKPSFIILLGYHYEWI